MRTVRALMCAQGCAFAIAMMAHHPDALAAEPGATTRLEDLPVVRATVFKDGTAMLVHRGDVMCDEDGNAIVSGLPAPILGTFWTSTPNAGQRIRSVRAGFEPVTEARDAATFTDLLSANIGRRATITLADREVSGEIIALPTQPRPSGSTPPSYYYGGNRPSAGDPDPPAQPMPSNVLVRDGESIHAIGLHSIIALKLPADAATDFIETRKAPALTIDFGPSAADTAADVELMYLQRGLRWIPNYRVTLGANGRAAVELQASVINDAVDLTDAPVEFIVGVPSFAFADAIDPISMRNVPPVLSGFFSTFTSNALANAIMTQVGALGRARDGTEAANPVPVESQGEDQFIYTYPSLTLAKGSRAVIPLKTFAVDATDIYRLHVPITPPADYVASRGDQRFTDLHRALLSPAVEHVVSFTNTSDAPITTAPVLVIAGHRPVAQSMTRYTPVGAEGEFALSTAVDITTTNVVEESGRTPDAISIDAFKYTKIDLEGTIGITNRKNEPVTVRVTRDVLGEVTSSTTEARVRRLGGIQEAEVLTPLPYRWWGWYGWTSWFSTANPISRIEWSVTLAPGESKALDYQWTFYSR